VPALAVLAVALAASGCGGDGDGGAEATTDPDALVPNKRDYIVQGDTICSNSNQGIRTEAEARFKIDSADFTVTPAGEIVFKPGRRPSPAEIESFGGEVIVPAFRSQLADLRALTPPQGDEATVMAIYDAAEAGIDRLEADPTVFGDSAAVRRELAPAQRLGRRYGFFDCGTYAAP
jgi:hypothetical protein